MPHPRASRTLRWFPTFARSSCSVAPTEPLLLLGTGLGLIPSTLATFRALPNAPEIALIVPEEEPASQAQYRRLGIHRVVPISGDLARLAALVRDLAARSRAK